MNCFCAEVKIDLVLVCGSKLPGFNVWIEIDLVFVCGPKMTRFPCGDRLTWFLYGWSKLTWFSHAGRKLLRFSVMIEIDLVFCVGGRNLLYVSVGDRTSLGFSVGMKLISV